MRHGLHVLSGIAAVAYVQPDTCDLDLDHVIRCPQVISLSDARSLSGVHKDPSSSKQQNEKSPGDEGK